MKRFLSLISISAALLLLSYQITLAESGNNAFNQGFEKHKQGDLKNAIKLYSKAIEQDPQFTMAYQMRGAALQQLKKYAQAIDDYSMVITVGEPYFKAVGYYNRGVVKNITRNYGEAIGDFSQAIVIDSKMAAAFFHRGIAKSKSGDQNGQLEDFRQAARLGDVVAERWLNTYYPAWKVMPAPVTPPVANPLNPVPVQGAPTPASN